MKIIKKKTTLMVHFAKIESDNVKNKMFITL